MSIIVGNLITFLIWPSEKIQFWAKTSAGNSSGFQLLLVVVGFGRREKHRKNQQQQKHEKNQITNKKTSFITEMGEKFVWNWKSAVADCISCNWPCKLTRKRSSAYLRREGQGKHEAKIHQDPVCGRSDGIEERKGEHLRLSLLRPPDDPKHFPRWVCTRRWLSSPWLGIYL